MCKWNLCDVNSHELSNSPFTDEHFKWVHPNIRVSNASTEQSDHKILSHQASEQEWVEFCKKWIDWVDLINYVFPNFCKRKMMGHDWENNWICEKSFIMIPISLSHSKVVNLGAKGWNWCLFTPDRHLLRPWHTTWLSCISSMCSQPSTRSGISPLKIEGYWVVHQRRDLPNYLCYAWNLI